MKPFLSLMIFCWIFTGSGKTQNVLINHDLDLGYLLSSLSLPAENLRIEVDKSDYVLSILSDSIVVKQYPVVFGGNPVDDKLRQGDRCTPEGRFRVIAKYPHRSWNKFIWFDYPNEESWEKHRRAKRKGTIPQSAKIGGEVGIHGVPRGTGAMIDLRINWTLGCIALKNKDIDEFYPYIREGTLVVIKK
jgi:murein L,D-transpeptidase YafK